jgi:nicotinamide phosphoribosyltransferase
MGSDTMSGILALMEYYNAPVSGFSIPAAEHSTVTSWGKDKEVDAYRNMLNQFAKPGALLAVVSDSYDIYNACEMWGTELKEQLVNSGAMVVIRPDSGVPEVVVPQVIRILDRRFGSVENDKGYKVLNNVRVIQGDGINNDSIRRILESITSIGYSADNVAFGQGGALLQALDRDTNRWAMKCSTVKVNGEWRDVFKDPVTDSGKRSKKGRITLVRDSVTNEIKTVLSADYMCQGADENPYTELLETVWENGELVRDQSLDEIRALSVS